MAQSRSQMLAINLALSIRLRSSLFHLLTRPRSDVMSYQRRRLADWARVTPFVQAHFWLRNERLLE